MVSLPADVRHQIRSDHGVITRSAALAAGLSDRLICSLVTSGEWERLYRGVYRPATSPVTVESDILSACLAAGAGAVASHQSAAWMWGLLPRVPTRQAVSVLRGARPRLSGVAVHRSGDLDLRRVVMRRGIPCTPAPRTVVDLAAVASVRLVDDVVDRALMNRRVTVEDLQAEIERLARPGRAGVGPARASLQRRGHVGPPAPSVLESAILRMFRRCGITPLATERWVEGGRYRIDVAVTRAVAVEVDGYAYHSSAAAMAADHERRNTIRLGGIFLLVFTWIDVIRSPERVARQILAAIQCNR